MDPLLKIYLLGLVSLIILYGLYAEEEEESSHPIIYMGLVFWPVTLPVLLLLGGMELLFRLGKWIGERWRNW